ncbi:GTP-binding protein [cf. Phormidesmis sp. LEGE 11477]|uniref:GTP-binding protein n=1 Tax=cf. Phormidesmis sp. LEGE 11477 TaxID=1828680 RepID=UPI00187E3C59|nr:GTP-binding protein [cf. Phormidesmis sp. LEGE 11477]MBE9062151.1 GTP-binding protein [cf. Phormidesmis sp. LEGE 11477]
MPLSDAPKAQNPLVEQARISLRQAIDRYIPQLKMTQLTDQELNRQTAVKSGIDQLTALMNKLDSSLLRVAVFGLVSRGKSAVINALMGEQILETGPLNGVTQWPRSVYWVPIDTDSTQSRKQPLKLELIDTPGLDEIEGQSRSKMARDIAQQSDLILFVVSGDVTNTEYLALQELYTTRKPLLLVFNKVDLYPDADRDSVANNLQTLWQKAEEKADLPQGARLVDDIVMISAAPAPIQVRVEWPDGHTTEEWETPSAQIEPLKQRLLEIVAEEGPTLIALNALRQAGIVEENLSKETAELNQARADELIWQYARYKAIAVAFNPIALLDLLGGISSDMVMIRALSQLYGFPMTRFEATKLWQSIIGSSGTLLLSEFGTSLILGFGKSGAAIWSAFESFSGLTAYAGAMTAQAGAAGYGTYAVGQAAKVYLQQGCTWGPQGVNTVMQNILSQAKTDSTLERLQAEIKETISNSREPRAEADGSQASTALATASAAKQEGTEKAAMSSATPLSSINFSDGKFSDRPSE